ncbi:MAG: 30S ribosomal protein S7 [Chloroflexi bacterium]|nr:30S ribosomal protein S7 [Chloroflexota bacterium]
MPRRGRVVKRAVALDPKYQSGTLTKFISRIMSNGKRSLAQRVVYSAMEQAENKARKSAMDVFEQALRNTTPLLEVKPRRVGGATYQVPVEIRAERRTALAMRWIAAAARARSGKTMAGKLAAELVDAAQGDGAAVKKREETHRMAEANKAFVHYRW